MQWMWFLWFIGIDPFDQISLAYSEDNKNGSQLMNLGYKLSIAKNFLKEKIFKRRIPIAVGWAITYRCNFQCKFCNRWQNPEEEISTHQAIDIINKLYRLGLRRINFSGGKPLPKRLLRPNHNTLLSIGQRVYSRSFK